MELSFTRYLSSKRSVDDRALNRQVWDALKNELHYTAQIKKVRVLELGMGIGTMFQRSLEWGLFTHAEYTGIDAEAENIEAARQIIPKWGRAGGWDVYQIEDQDTFEGTHGVAYRFIRADLYDFLRQPQWRSYFDVVIANAVLDLVDLESVLPLISACLRQGGLGYFSINFDGTTAFEPVVDAELDEQIIRYYHQSMDDRLVNDKPNGGSRTGRRLFHALKLANFEVVEIGASDWVVFPHPDHYPADEAYFLHFILHFFEETIPKYPQINPIAFENWLRTRRSQIERGELMFMAHQLDYLVKKS
mgnify:FL=1